MQIRKLTNEELELAVELNIDCWNTDYAGVVPPNVINKDKMLNSITEWINEENDDIRRIYGGFEGDSFAGFVGASIAEVEDSKKGVEINYLFVKQEYRGRVLGIQLMKTVVEEFKGYGFQECIIYNWHEVASNKFYRQLGGVVKNQMVQTPKGQEALVDLFVWDIEHLLQNLKIKKYVKEINQIINLQEKIKIIDESLSKFYPIALVDEGQFLLFDFQEEIGKYVYINTFPTKIPIPQGIKAALDLYFYDNKMGAVLSNNTFETIEGYIFTFHEFVHCYQEETCIGKIKEKLKIYRVYEQDQNTMWQLNHPFPYGDTVFVEKTNNLNIHFDRGDIEAVKEYYRFMKDYLKDIDFEYMILQQWKEGFARYIENLIRKELGVPQNTQGIIQPYTRVSFYEVGSRYIDMLLRDTTGLKNNLEVLFDTMLKGQAPR